MKQDGCWTRSDQEKADIAEHLVKIFIRNAREMVSEEE